MPRKTVSTLFLSLALSLALVTPLPGAGFQGFDGAPPLSDLPGRWSELMDLFDVPGAAVVVVKDGSVHIETFGIRAAAGGQPVTPDTLFYVASVTKTYTATAIGTLVDQGRLSLDDRVKDHLPGLRLSDAEVEEALTIGDLLSHRRGLRSPTAVLLDAFSGEITEDRYYHWLARGQVEGKVRYSNTHYTLAGRIIEKVTGMGWRQYLQASVLEPAGLARTTGFASVMYGDPDSAAPLRRAADGSWEVVSERKTDRTMHAAGGLGTTARDAARYLALHLANGEQAGTRVVSAAFMESMRKPHSAHEEPQGSIRIMEGFGLGWQVGTYAGEVPLLSHGGGYVGASAYFALLPDQNAAVAILINSGGRLPAGWGDIVAVDLLERLTGRAPPWSPFEQFTARARQMKAQRKAEEPGRGRLPLSALSHPVGEYTGWFRNPELGTLIVEPGDRGLEVRLGDAPLEAAAGGNADEFTLGGHFEPPARCRFAVTDAGKVIEVHLEDEDLGGFVFKR